MHRASPSKLALARTTLKQLDEASLRAVGGGKVRERERSYLDSCLAFTGCGGGSEEV